MFSEESLHMTFDQMVASVEGLQNQQGKADLHIHTRYSDGAASAAAVLAHVAQYTELQVIAITDHDTIAGALEARRLAPAYNVEVIVGEEVSTTEGHLLALFIEQPLPPGRPMRETIAAARAQGGLCFAAHPYDFTVPSIAWRGLRHHAAGTTPQWPLDGVEVFNAGLLIPYANTLARKLAAQLGLAMVGGSDSHHLTTIGYGYTLFPGRTAADLRAAIQQGQVQAAGRPWGWKATLEAAGSWLSQTIVAPSRPTLDRRMRPGHRPASPARGPVGRPSSSLHQ
jgi:predicted metal-dependent phosphoesterase TrpH